MQYLYNADGCGIMAFSGPVLRDDERRRDSVPEIGLLGEEGGIFLARWTCDGTRRVLLVLPGDFQLLYAVSTSRARPFVGQ